MNQALFLSEQYIKDIAPISANVTISSPLKQCIYDAQNFFILPILCEPLFIELESQIIGASVSAPNVALLNEIKPCLAYYSLYQFLPFSMIKIREQGPIRETGVNGDVIETNDMTYLRGVVHASAKNYEILLLRFLQNNSANYPLWNNGCCNTCNTDCNIVKKSRLFRYV